MGEGVITPLGRSPAGPAGASEKNPNTDSPRARARGTPDAAPSGQTDLARLLAKLEDGLRRQGFAASTIARRRKANRALLAALISTGDRLNDR